MPTPFEKFPPPGEEEAGRGGQILEENIAEHHTNNIVWINHVI